MTRQCVRPGCSEPGEIGYGFSPRALLVWLTPIRTPEDEVEGVLCRRHADLTTVPRGWTLDDRRETVPRLFRPPARLRHEPRPEPEAEAEAEPGPAATDVAPGAPEAEPAPAPDHTGEQLRLGAGELDGALDAADADETEAAEGETEATEVTEVPDATGALDLTGATERPDPEIVAGASSELLARAFLGTTRRQPRRRMRP